MAYNISDWCELEVTKLWLMISNIKKKKKKERDSCCKKLLKNVQRRHATYHFVMKTNKHTLSPSDPLKTHARYLFCWGIFHASMGAGSKPFLPGGIPDVGWGRPLMWRRPWGIIWTGNLAGHSHVMRTASPEAKARPLIWCPCWDRATGSPPAWSGDAACLHVCVWPRFSNQNICFYILDLKRGLL